VLKAALVVDPVPILSGLAAGGCQRGSDLTHPPVRLVYRILGKPWRTVDEIANWIKKKEEEPENSPKYPQLALEPTKVSNPSPGEQSDTKGLLQWASPVGEGNHHVLSAQASMRRSRNNIPRSLPFLPASLPSLDSLRVPPLFWRGNTLTRLQYRRLTQVLSL